MLPKIDVPIYNVKLLSTGKSLRFRPFTVKEEKLFLMANEGEDLTTIVDTIKQILNNCILDEFQIDSLPLFDIEYLFLKVLKIKVLNLKIMNQNLQYQNHLYQNLLEVEVLNLEKEARRKNENNKYWQRRYRYYKSK